MMKCSEGLDWYRRCFLAGGQLVDLEAVLVDLEAVAVLEVVVVDHFFLGFCSFLLLCYNYLD